MSATNPRSLTRMKSHTDPTWASDRIIELERERDEAIAERDRLREVLEMVERALDPQTGSGRIHPAGARALAREALREAERESGQS